MQLILIFGMLFASFSGAIGLKTKVVAESGNILFSESAVETSYRDHYPESGNITCLCNGQAVVQKLNGINLELIYGQFITPQILCKLNFSGPACEAIRLCSGCDVEIRWCQPLIGNTEKYICHTKNQLIPDFMEENLLVPSATPTAEIGLHRSRRQAGFYMNACGFPTHFQKSDMTCIKFGYNMVKCVQDCIFGHTLGESARKIRRCLFRENKWVPEGEFKDCEPYMHCTLELLSNGTFTCATSTVHIPAHCNVSCYSYGSMPSTPLQTYFCTENGWSLPLPHCVLPKEGQFELVPRPVKPRQSDRDVPVPQILHSFIESTEMDFIQSIYNVHSKFEPVSIPKSELLKINPSWSALGWYRDEPKMVSDTTSDSRKHKRTDFVDDENVI